MAAALPGVRRTLWRGVFWDGTEQAIIGYRDRRQYRPNGQVAEWVWVGGRAAEATPEPLRERRG